MLMMLFSLSSSSLVSKNDIRMKAKERFVLAKYIVCGGGRRWQQIIRHAHKVSTFASSRTEISGARGRKWSRVREGNESLSAILFSAINTQSIITFSCVERPTHTHTHSLVSFDIWKDFSLGRKVSICTSRKKRHISWLFFFFLCLVYMPIN